MVFTLKDYSDSVLDFKWLIKLSVFEPPTFVSRSTNCALLLVERCIMRNGSKLLIFFDY